MQQQFGRQLKKFWFLGFEWGDAIWTCTQNTYFKWKLACLYEFTDIHEFNFIYYLHYLSLLTCTTDGFYVTGIQGFMEDQDCPQLALQGCRASPLTVLGPCRDEFGHRLRLCPQQAPPRLRWQDASQRGASGGCGGGGEGRVWDLGRWWSGGPVASRADATGCERLLVEYKKIW